MDPNLTPKLEYWVNPDTRAERITKMSTELLRNIGYPLTRDAAEHMASERMNFLEGVVGHLMEPDQADVEQSVQLEIPIL